MCMSAEVLNGRILRAIEVVRSTLKGLPEGEGGVSTFQLVTVLTDVEEALLGKSDAPDTSKSGAIEPHQGPPIAVTPFTPAGGRQESTHWLMLHCAGLLENSDMYQSLRTHLGRCEPA